MLTRPRYAAITVAAVGLIVFAGALLASQGGPPSALVSVHLGLVAFSAFALTCVVTATITGSGRQRVSWACLIPGLAGWLAGELIRAYSAVTTQAPPPFPSMADAAFLLLPLSTCVAALFTPRGRAGVRLLLDGVIVASSLFMVAWSFGMDELYRASDVSFLQFVVYTTYPFADLAMVTMISVVLIKTPRGRRHAATLLTAGLVLIAITDTAFVYLTGSPARNGGVIVFGWALGLVLVGAAALVSKPFPPDDGRPQPPPSRIAMWLPYAPVPVAIAVGAVALWSAPETRPILGAGLLLVFAALIRQFTLIDENQRLLVTVSDIALRDPLTDLANRTLFTDRLAHAMQLRLRKAAPLAVLLLDLDDFKLVNDSLGHPAGDALLRSVGERIQGSLRDGDTVARLGGDEFAVLIEDDPESAHAVAEAVVSALDEPFVVDGREVFVRSSVGIAVAPSTGEPELTADDLFRRADLAMYSAKRAKFKGVRAFTSGMRLDATELQLSSGATTSPDAIDRIQLLGDLRHAIDNGELTLVYQPKFSLSTNTVVGVEALVRWPHPTLGTLLPADFLPLVRQSGLMDDLTELVLSRAVEEAAGWYAAGVEIPVAINLAATSLDDQALPDRLLSALTEHDMPASSLSVEITEDMLLASVARTRIVLNRLRQNGIRVAIDDFGSGYAAMTYLRELPVDEIKIDRHFVAPILRDPRAAAIVESVIELADTFGISCVAEGVEDGATANRLREFGCGYAQGHHFSTPVSAEAVRQRTWGPRSASALVTQTATTQPSSA